VTRRSSCAFAFMIVISTAPEFVSRVAYAGGRSEVVDPADRASIDHRVSKALKRFKEGDLDIRLRALGRLEKFGTLAAPPIPDLITALDDPEPIIRSRSAYLLGSIGPAAKEAVPALIRLLRNPGEAVNSKT
jgi:HEAT repeat protein